MQVGLYFDLRNPPPWRQDPARVYGFTLEMCQEAERLGAGSVWVTEHHLFDDGYLTQPLTFCSAIAACTKRIRIGTAILLAPLHSAIEIAEQATVVDLVSNGRLDLGLGSGYRVPEFQLYGVEFEQRFALLHQRVREVRGLWSDPRVTPHPVQARIPIWVGLRKPEAARRVGRLGEGLLVIDPALLEPYRQGLIDGGHDPSSARMSGPVSGWVSEDPEADWPVVAKHLRYQLESYMSHAVEGTERKPRPVDVEQMRKQGYAGSALTAFLHGTPAQVANAIKTACQGLPVHTVLLWASIAGMPEALVAKHVNTVCTKLAPLLANA
jgi:alkanesulfonate monooxygenase SsuD/methylene tetrahydromethanopterin reductase-like flavin-dependent oxidoreductase (luciferase family)